MNFRAPYGRERTQSTDIFKRPTGAAPTRYRTLYTPRALQLWSDFAFFVTSLCVAALLLQAARHSTARGRPYGPHAAIGIPARARVGSDANSIGRGRHLNHVKSLLRRSPLCHDLVSRIIGHDRQQLQKSGCKSRAVLVVALSMAAAAFHRACPTCTFINEDFSLRACAICQTALPSTLGGGSIGGDALARPAASALPKGHSICNWPLDDGWIFCNHSALSQSVARHQRELAQHGRHRATLAQQAEATHEPGESMSALRARSREARRPTGVIIGALRAHGIL